MAEQFNGQLQLPFPLARISWDQIGMGIADLIAQRSLCTRAQVGAVIITPDKEIISPSYNGPPSGMNLEGPCSAWCDRCKTGNSTPDYSNCPSIHAESNCLIRADHSKIRGGTIYVSSSCCMGCAKNISNSGISRVVHRVDEHRTYRDHEQSERFLNESGLTVERYINAIS